METDMAGQMRPQGFTQLVGQPYATGVGKRIASGAVSQRYLLAGPRGCGKTSLARIIAKSVNCYSPDSETGNPCNECSSCTLIDRRMHPQVEEINAAAHRGVNDIREKLSTISLAVPRGKKVYILDEVHMLTREAFSLLLKPMEEPPESVIFIATTTNPDSVPDTIMSRCAMIPILPLSNEELKDVLEAVREYGLKDESSSWEMITDDDIDAAILTAEGSARQAITSLTSILLHGVSSTAASESEDIIAAFRTGSVAEVLSLVSSRLTTSKEDPSLLLSQVMNGLISKMGSGDDDEHIARQVAKLSTQSITLSTPAVSTAAKISACVQPLTEYHQVNKAIPEDRMKKESRPSVERKKVNESLTIEKAIDHILHPDAGKKVLTKRWRDILDDENRSSMDINHGTLRIGVVKPDQALRTGLSALFDKVEVFDPNRP